MRGLFVLLLLTGACQRKAPVPSCDAMANHVRDMMAPVDAFARGVGDVFAKRCTDDKWSEEARSCIGATQSMTDPQGCKKLLAAEQTKKLETDLDEVARRTTTPIACARYEQALAKILACDKVARDIRDGLKARFDAAKAGWPAMPDKRGLAELCSSGTALLKQAGADCPGADQW